MGRDAASNQSRSLWMEAEIPVLAPLSAETNCDVCIIGAGIAGLTTAWRLARRGLDVVVLDDGPLGRGESGRTTAHLASAVDDRYHRIEHLHGAEAARIVGDSHRAAIDTIEAIVRDHAIDCGFARVDGWLFVPPGDDPGILERELDAATRAGLVVELVERAPFPDFDTGPALRFADQAQVHPLRYLAGLLRAGQELGVRVLTAHALQIRPDQVETAAGVTVSCRAVVVATCSPISDVVAMHTKLAAYRSYVIAARLPRGQLPPGLYWDTPDPYHYLRLDPGTGPDGDDLVIVGGEDHKTGQDHHPQERWDRLETWTRARLPRLGEVVRRWSGQIIEPVDGLAFIGPDPAYRTAALTSAPAPAVVAAPVLAGAPIALPGQDVAVWNRREVETAATSGSLGGMAPPVVRSGVYIATGDSGNGMTHGTIAGLLLGDLVAGHDHPWAALYDPSRRTLRALGDFAKENLNVAARYGQWATPGDAKDADGIARGCGAVVRRGLRKVAIFRDQDGTRHERSAVCPHLGCVVGWNDAERSWDCPCHGSRFDRFGTVVNGPASADLASLGKPLSPAKDAHAHDHG